MAVLDKYNIVNGKYISKSGDISVEIGDTKQTVMFPQVKFSKWANECNFSIRILGIDISNISPNHVGDKIEFTIGNNYILRFYDTNGFNSEGSGFEFELEIKKKPVRNYFDFSFESKNITADYQPPLTDLTAMYQAKFGSNITVTATEVRLSDGTLVASRPDNVVGSYAIYHNSKQNNEYKTGKLFHLYAPYLIDAHGNKSKCTLTLDLVTKTGRLTADQTFLNNATYPIVLDPTFGYTSIGASSDSYDNGVFMEANVTTDAGGFGTMSDIKVAAWCANSGKHIRLAVYSVSGNDRNLIANTDSGQIEISRTTKPTQDSEWTVSTSPTANVTDTTVAICMNNDDYTVYMAGDSAASHLQYIYSAYGDFPDASKTLSGYYTFKFSAYATYSSGGGGSSIKTILGLAKASVKTVEGLAIASVKTIEGLS